MAAATNSKELIVVNCQEIPESICVETRFVTKAAAKQKENEYMFHITNKNGSFELVRQENRQKNFTPVNKSTTVTLSLQAKSPVIPISTVPSPQQIQTPNTILPFVTAVPNLNNSGNSNCNTFSNPIKDNALNSALKIPLVATPQMPQPFNLNTPVLPANPLGTASNLRITNLNCSLNDQVQQTDISAFAMNSIAIQCNLDEDIEGLIEWPPQISEPIVNSDNLQAEKENFIEFVKANSTEHKNYKECLICGEVGRTDNYFYAHMTIHQEGSRALCSKCGMDFEHENLLFKHKCITAKQLEQAFLQCPHHTCNVKALSRLELYDHINEHTNNRIYKCSGCRKSFCTCQEFLRHLLIRAKCYTSAKRKRFRFYGLDSPKDRSCRLRVFTLHTFKKCTTLVKTFLSQRASKDGVCKLCLKHFTNKYVYNRHCVNCTAKFRKRLLRKKNKIKNNQ